MGGGAETAQQFSAYLTRRLMLGCEDAVLRGSTRAIPVVFGGPVAVYLQCWRATGTCFAPVLSSWL